MPPRRRAPGNERLLILFVATIVTVVMAPAPKDAFRFVNGFPSQRWDAAEDRDGAYFALEI